jgi:hypothetical protein
MSNVALDCKIWPVDGIVCVSQSLCFYTQEVDGDDGLSARRRSRQRSSWIRGLHGHLSLMSQANLLDMDESDDVSDEYEVGTYQDGLNISTRVFVFN